MKQQKIQHMFHLLAEAPDGGGGGGDSLRLQLEPDPQGHRLHQRQRDEGAGVPAERTVQGSAGSRGPGPGAPVGSGMVWRFILILAGSRPLP